MRAGLEDIRTVEILPGKDAAGRKERQGFSISSGEIVAIVGPTGSGKSQLLWDIETLSTGKSRSGRVVLVDGEIAPEDVRRNPRVRPVAVVSQSMSFTIDRKVKTFLRRHAEVRGIEDAGIVDSVIEVANSICGEPIDPGKPLSALSGGQSRALMVSDVALISASPIVLVDEVENAGIDRNRALEVLSKAGKMTLIVTHDPIQALAAHRRVVMAGGGIRKVVERTREEERLREKLVFLDDVFSCVREEIRVGNVEVGKFCEKLSCIAEV